MLISLVTMTGADDKTSQDEMLEISKEFPFVEWAILFSQSKAGVPRYPSFDWVTRLWQKVQKSSLNLNFSAHLCGKWTEDAMKGIFGLVLFDESSMFNRIQLNLGRDRLAKALNSEKLADGAKALSLVDFPKSVIIGGNYEGYKIDVDHFWKHNMSVLWDASGGRGIAAKEWPAPLKTSDGVYPAFGYAGGLGPDNVTEELDKIAKVVATEEYPEGSFIWIDMETKIRTDDVLDMKKVRSVLEQVQSWKDANERQ